MRTFSKFKKITFQGSDSLQNIIKPPILNQGSKSKLLIARKIEVPLIRRKMISLVSEM